MLSLLETMVTLVIGGLPGPDGLLLPVGFDPPAITADWKNRLIFVFRQDIAALTLANAMGDEEELNVRGSGVCIIDDLPLKGSPYRQIAYTAGMMAVDYAMPLEVLWLRQASKDNYGPDVRWGIHEAAGNPMSMSMVMTGNAHIKLTERVL